jgi:glycosyltransferase involved in cell wall biosynthesis
VEELLRAADFLVQGSHREGSGFAVVEALATGTPPVVSDIPPFRALTGGGSVGFLARPGDPLDFARCLREAAASDRRALGLAARDHFDRALSFQVLGRRLADSYRVLRP